MKKEKLRRSGIKIMASLITLLGSLAYIMLLAVLNGSLGYICSMGVTVFGAIGIAKVLDSSLPISYTVIVIGAIGCGLLRGLLRYIEQYSNHYIAFRLLALLRDKIFGALRRLCPAKLETKKKGSIIAMITSDIETLEVFYAHTISPICICIIVSLAVLLTVGFLSSFYLSLVALVGYLTIGIILPLLSSKRLKAAGVRYREEFSSFNAYFLDSVKGIKDITVYQNGEKRKEEIDRRTSSLLKETKFMKNISAGATAITEAFVSIFIILSLLVGIILYRNNMISFSEMLISLVLIFSSFGPVIAISALPSNLTQTFASGDRVLNLLKEEPVVKEIANGKDIDGPINLEVNDLSFEYPDDNKETLKEINLAVNNGEIIGIVGESGCGKSTLLKLLLRFYSKEKGSIKYNDEEIENINTSSLYKNVTMVSQSTYLFDDTIENNLRIAKEDATEEEMIEACKQASIHDFISSLEDGYKTKVGSLRNNISAGEKQRIGLARAFLRGSKLILLDEPTSNVDSINEGIILKALKDKREGRAIILVSHRESTMAIADRTYKISDGRIERK